MTAHQRSTTHERFKAQDLRSSGPTDFRNLLDNPFLSGDTFIAHDSEPGDIQNNGNLPSWNTAGRHMVVITASETAKGAMHFWMPYGHTMLPCSYNLQKLCWTPVPGGPVWEELHCKAGPQPALILVRWLNAADYMRIASPVRASIGG